MKAVQIASPEQLKIVDVEKPVIDNRNNVLIRMTAAGICGSDVGIYHGTNAAATYPRIIGHEMVGRVAEIGASVTGLKAGDRVIGKRKCLRSSGGKGRTYRWRLPGIYCCSGSGLLFAAGFSFR